MGKAFLSQKEGDLTLSATLTPDPVEELDLLPPEASFDPGDLSTSRPWTPLGPQRDCSVPQGELGNLQGRREFPAEPLLTEPSVPLGHRTGESTHYYAPFTVNCDPLGRTRV